MILLIAIFVCVLYIYTCFDVFIHAYICGGRKINTKYFPPYFLMTGMSLNGAHNHLAPLNEQ